MRTFQVLGVVLLLSFGMAACDVDTAPNASAPVDDSVKDEEKDEADPTDRDEPGPSACSEGAVLAECQCAMATVTSGFCCAGEAQDRACGLAVAFYVSPEGNDANEGVSLSVPFRTLEKARDAARASETTKTIYLLNGTYDRGETLRLDVSDKGQSWLAYPGQRPVLDGGTTTSTAIQINGDDISVRWIEFQNFVANTIRIGEGDAKKALIDSNTIINTLSGDEGEQAAIYICCGIHADVQITHNLIDGADDAGIRASSSAASGAARRGASEGDISGLTIAHNAVYNACRSVDDCGAVSVSDPAAKSANISFDNNVIGNFGTATNGSRALSLDDNASNVTLTNNIVYGEGQWAVRFHGGSSNSVSNNIFDVSELGAAITLYEENGEQTPPEQLQKNSFTCNIVYTEKEELPDPFVETPKGGVSGKALGVSGNVYGGFKAGGTATVEAPKIDLNPKVVPPGAVFNDPAEADYSFAGENPGEEFCGFKPIDQTAVGPRPNR